MPIVKNHPIHIWEKVVRQTLIEHCRILNFMERSFEIISSRHHKLIALDFNLVSLCPETLFYYHQIYPFVFSCSLYFFVCHKKSFPTWKPKIYFSIFSIEFSNIIFYISAFIHQDLFLYTLWRGN